LERGRSTTETSEDNHFAADARKPPFFKLRPDLIARIMGKSADQKLNRVLATLRRSLSFVV